MMKPLVSVIVTSYNHAEYLEQRMKSLLAQTYDNIEIIVVDDCSTDGSREVLEDYRGNSSVNLVFLEENGGYASACNFGLDQSRGAYVMFAECDDYNDPDHIRTLVNIMEQNGRVGAAYCRSNIVDEKGAILGTDYDVRDSSFKSLCENDVLIPSGIMARFFLFACVIPNMSAALIRKKDIERVGRLSPEFLACADWDFWCRMAEQNDFFYVTNAMNYFRTHSETVRKKASAALQVGEYYDLLYRLYSKMKITFPESLRFRLNCGFLWANFLVLNPTDWIESFPTVCRKSFMNDKLSVLFLFLGLVKKAGHICVTRVLG